jgi:hypothetical protein
MAQQIINIGAVANDGTGDQLRISFDKCNGNFTELYSGVAANVPTGNTIQYLFNNSTTEPPLSGQVRFNQAVQASTTKLWVSQTTSSGINIKQFLSVATTGAKLILQDKNDNTNYVKFDVTAAPVDKTTYWEFTVAVTASGGTLPNAPVLAAVTPPVGGVYAAPFDALAYNGMQINGSMEVSQENGSSNVSISNATKYVVDGWNIQSAGAQVISAAQAPTGPSGFTSCLRAAVSTANASPAAGDYCMYVLPLEGYRISRLAWGTASAQPITIGFWVYSNRVGTYSGSAMGAVPARSYVFTFTVNSASTWEYKTITIPGDTTAAWATNNTKALHIIISMMCGSSVQTTPGAWNAGQFFGATGTFNGVGSTSDALQIAGVVVIPGIDAPSAARSPLIMRPYDQELVACKRYWQLIMPDIRLNAAGAGSVYAYTCSLPVEMRAVPTNVRVAAGSSSSNVSSYTLAVPTNKEIRPTLVSSASGDCYVFAATFSLDARL